MRIEFQIEGDASERIRDLAGASLSSARRELIQQAGIQCLQSIIESNPVETGRSRAAWISALEQLGGSAASGWDGSGSEGAAEGRGLGHASLNNDEQSTQVVATNQVKYVPYLEYGTSRMAPFAMVRQGILQLRNSLSDLFRLS